MPNILTIDKIDKLLDGKHPDEMGDIKNKFRLGMFLAKPKKDPLTRAFLNGSMMEKAYDFSVPEDPTEIPDETPEEIERDQVLRPHNELQPQPQQSGTEPQLGAFSYKPGTAASNTN